MRGQLFVVVAAVALCGCPKKDDKKDEPRAPAKREAVRLEPLERVQVDAGDDAREAQYQVAPFVTLGPSAPGDAVKVELDGEKATADGAAFEVAKLPVGDAGVRRVLLVMKGETYLAQAAAVLAALDDAKAEVWLAHPDGALAFKVVLRDEPAFQLWLDEASDSGKVRVIHRADGFELQTAMGKLPGPDVNGPSVPVRGGQLDLATLQKGLARLQSRFVTAPDYCVVPSFGMVMNDVVKGLAANYVKVETPYFPTTCLVYPRPRPDAGK